MKVIRFLLKESVKHVLFAGFLSITAAALYILALRSFSDVVNFSQGQTPNNLFLMIGFILSSALLATIAGHYIANFFEFKISDQRVAFSELVLKSSFEKIEKSKELIVPTLHNDIITLANFAKGLPDFIVSLFTVAAIWGYMFFISWQFTLIFIGVFLVSMLIIFTTQPYLYREERKAITHRNLMHMRLNGLVDGIKELTLDLDHKEVYANQLIGEASTGFARHTVNRNKVIIASGKISESFILISLGIIFIVSTYYFTSAKDFFIEFFTLITFTLPSLIRIGLFFSNLKKAEVALDQIDNLGLILEQYADRASTGHGKKLIKPSSFDESNDPAISLSNMHYSYLIDNQKTFTVGPFNIDVKKNEVLIIKGGNGSGKTTFIKLLTGLYRPSSGNLSFQGEIITDDNLAEYRNLFSAVFADSFVFQDLGYITHDRVEELSNKYLDLLEIREKVTLINGIELSTTSLSFGQKSRLNLFRSLLEDKEYYVFDEWAANQDPYFKNKFYTEIIPTLKKEGKTVIIISHDDQYYHIADRIVTMKAGTIQEENTSAS